MNVFILDVLVWLVIHLSISYGCYTIPSSWFHRHAQIFRPLGLEQDGRGYERIFQIKRWKSLLPDGSALFKNGFRKKHLTETTTAYFQTFIIESRRAEFTHWLCFLPLPLFFLWNDRLSGLIMIGYAILANLPCIIAQRYNRLRLERVMEKSNRRHSGLAGRE